LKRESETSGSLTAQSQASMMDGQHIPSKLQQFLTGDQTCVRSRVGSRDEVQFLTINELWTFLDDEFVQTIQLLTVHIRIDCLHGITFISDEAVNQHFV